MVIAFIATLILRDRTNIPLGAETPEQQESPIRGTSHA